VNGDRKRNNALRKREVAMPKTIFIGAMLAVLIAAAFVPAYADENQADSKKTDQQKAQGLDMVSDVVSSTFSKANALLAGDLEVTMSRDEDMSKIEKQYTTNALGQKVPKQSAVRGAGSLHERERLN